MANKAKSTKTNGQMAPKKAQAAKPVVIDDTDLELDLDLDLGDDEPEAEPVKAPKAAPAPKAKEATKAAPKEAKLPKEETERGAKLNYATAIRAIDALGLEGVSKLSNTTSREKYQKGTLLLKVYPDPKSVVVKVYGNNTKTPKLRLVQAADAGHLANLLFTEGVGAASDYLVGHSQALK